MRAKKIEVHSSSFQWIIKHVPMNRKGGKTYRQLEKSSTRMLGERMWWWMITIEALNQFVGSCWWIGGNFSGKYLHSIFIQQDNGREKVELKFTEKDSSQLLLNNEKSNTFQFLNLVLFKLKANRSKFTQEFFSSTSSFDFFTGWNNIFRGFSKLSQKWFEINFFL